MQLRDNKGHFIKGSGAPPNGFKKGVSSWNAGTHGLMAVPWNKGVSVRLSPNSEFKKGVQVWNKGMIGYKQPEGTGEKISAALKGKQHKDRGAGTKYILKTGKCQYCGKEFTTYNINPKYCSRSCSGKHRPPPNLGKKFSEARRIQMSLSKRGKNTGEDNYQWKKDRTIIMEKHRLRNTFEWKKWRGSVFERDEFTCQECGVKGGYLEPHHIIPLRVNMDMIFDIHNGISLCSPCHKRTIKKEEFFIEKYLDIIKQKGGIYFTSRNKK